MTLARTVRFGGLLLALATGRPLGAQTRAAVELGASYVRFPVDTVSAIGPSVRLMASAARGRLAGGASASGVASFSGLDAFADAAGTWLSPLGLGWSGELAGEAGALLASTSSEFSSSTILSARLLRAFRAGGVWLRGNGGLSRREAGALWSRGVDAGGWWRRPGTELTASLVREWAMAQLFTGPKRQGLVGTVPVHYTEGSVGVRLEWERSSLAVSAQLRRDPGAEHLFEPGFSATASVWRSPMQALLISATRQLPDFVRGADALQSFSVGLRLNEPSPALARARATRPIIQLGDAESVEDSTGMAMHVLRVRAPAATRVEVMGDFTEWEAVELALAGDVFSRAFTLRSGSHRVVVRIDGGPWMPAANTPAVDDDFGGRVGLLVVP